MSEAQRMQSFSEFWPYYIGEHRHPAVLELLAVEKPEELDRHDCVHDKTQSREEGEREVTRLL